MNKHLLSTSAIALGVAMASPAAAQQWNLDWGGFINSHVGITDVDIDDNAAKAGGDFDGVDTFQDSEIIFDPNITLDNGMTFGFEVQIEGLNRDDRIDESFLYIESDTLGRIQLGSENSAGYLLMGSVYTPHPSNMPINTRSTSAFIPVTGSTGFRQAGLSSLTEVAGNNDINRITYFTPSFNGLTVGVSYAAQDEDEAVGFGGTDRDEAGNVTDIFDIGVGYQQSFNGVDLALAARWGTGDRNAQPAVAAVPATPGDPGSAAIAAAPSGDPTTWAVGATVGVAGWNLGATYAENDDDATGGIGDQEGYSFGAVYDIPGPWSAGITSYFGEEDTAGQDNEYTAIQVGAKRDLGPGVSWDIYYVYQETQNSDGAEIEGNLLATAINLSF